MLYFPGNWKKNLARLWRWRPLNNVDGAPILVGQGEGGGGRGVTRIFVTWVCGLEVEPPSRINITAKPKKHIYSYNLKQNYNLLI